MLDKDMIVDLRKIVSTTGTFEEDEVLSDENKVYGTLKDAGAEEKVRASSEDRENVCRIDVNEESYEGETICIFEDLSKKEIYKTAQVKNKVYLYMSDIKVEQEDADEDEEEI